jgi:hypothetical protein
MLRFGMQRILSLFVALGYLVAILAHAPGFAPWHDPASGPGQINLITPGIVLLLALPLIWFSDEIADATGYWTESSLSMTQVDKPSPAILISFFGWFFLIGPFVLWCFYG